MNAWKAWTRSRLAGLGIALFVVLFFAVNMTSERMLSQAKLDVTEEGLHTLSEGTLGILESIEEPIVLRYFVSPALTERNPSYALHARRVEETLALYDEIGGDKLIVETYEPEPFSPEEDRALAEGLRGRLGGAEGSNLYFGISGVNATDDREVIAFLNPQRARFLEYDLTQMVGSLANPEKPVVGLMGSLNIKGGQVTNGQPLQIHEALASFYELRALNPNRATIPADVDVLVLTQPDRISQHARYAIDQFLMGGGRVVAFLDPYSEYLAATGQQGTFPPSVGENMAPLLKSWGIRLDPDNFAGDPELARRVGTVADGRQKTVDYVAWLLVTKEHFAQDDPTLANLEQLALHSAGILEKAEEGTTTVEPLVTTSERAIPIRWAELMGRPDPERLLARFIGKGEELTLAARIKDGFESAFPDGPPEAVGETGRPHRAEVSGSPQVVVVADSDFLVDSTWLQRTVFGVSPSANNGDFLANTLDQLTGSEGLQDLRGRGVGNRPFELIEDIRAEAEAEYREEEQALTKRIEEAQQELAQLRQGEEGSRSEAERQEAIAELREELLESRQRLRAVQHALREEIETVETWVVVANTWAVPALITLGAVILALVRRFATRRRIATARQEA